MRLAYETRGQGPTVVLIHGFPLDRHMWDDQVASLSDGYRVIAPDLRGHGESPSPEGVATIGSMTDDVMELLETLSVAGPIVVGGLSMGGYIALDIAARHPGRLLGLMLLNTRAAADPPETARVREELAQKVESQKSPAPAVDAMLPKLFAPSTKEGRPDLIDSLKARMMRTPPAGVAGALRGMAIRPDRTGDLAAIRVSTLVLAGGDDQLIPRAESERMASAIPGARLVIVEGAGHLAPVEQPEATDRTIREFLGGLPTE